MLLVVGATPLLAQSDWAAVRPTPMVTLEIRKIVGMLMLVPAVTLFLLYLFRPRRYVLAGVTSWAAGSVMMLVLSFDSGGPHPAAGPEQVSVGRLAVVLWALALYEITDHELETHRRYKLPLSILYLDIDHFKAINDTRGHHTGDEVLKTLGLILKELTRQADYVFRWGGDKFIVLLSAGEAGAKIKAQQIRRAFLESAIVGNLPDGVDAASARYRCRRRRGISIR